MTTKFLDNKFALSIFIVVAFPKKNPAFLDDFPLCPQAPSPPQKRKFYFYCRLAVSEYWPQKLGFRKGMSADKFEFESPVVH